MALIYLRLSHIYLKLNLFTTFKIFLFQTLNYKLNILIVFYIFFEKLNSINFRQRNNFNFQIILEFI